MSIREKLIFQLFIGKVSEEIGEDKCAELLQEAREAFEDDPQNNLTDSTQIK